MKHLFIINPAAGKGKSLEYIEEIKKIFKNKDDEFIIEKTRFPGHAIEIARRYSNQDKFRIYSIGGDGTLNEVLNGMAGSSSSLAVIPAGSGNDFIKTIYSSNDMDNVLERTIEGKEEELDLAKLNGRYFINISSVGLDAEVVYNAVKLKRLPFLTGSLAYFLSIFITIFKYKSSFLEIDIDEKQISRKSLLLAVANGKYYGGGMLPTPEADIRDGKLDICLVRDLSIIKILRFFPKFIKGAHGDLEEVNFYKGNSIRVSCSKELSVNIDGEIFREKQVNFEIIPKGIKIVIPNK